MFRNEVRRSQQGIRRGRTVPLTLKKKERKEERRILQLEVSQLRGKRGYLGLGKRKRKKERRKFLHLQTSTIPQTPSHVFLNLCPIETSTIDIDLWHAHVISSITFTSASVETGTAATSIDECFAELSSMERRTFADESRSHIDASRCPTARSKQPKYENFNNLNKCALDLTWQLHGRVCKTNNLNDLQSYLLSPPNFKSPMALLPM